MAVKKPAFKKKAPKKGKRVASPKGKTRDHLDLPRPAPHPSKRRLPLCKTAPTNPEGLTRLQFCFCKEYMLDHCGSAAVIRAGYDVKNENSAAVKASLLLREVNIQRTLALMERDQQMKREVDKTQVLREWAYIGLSDIGEILDFSGPIIKLKPANQIPEHARRAISKVKVRRVLEGPEEHQREVELIEFAFWDKNTALEKLGRILGLINDRLRIDGTLDHDHKHRHAHLHLQSQVEANKTLDQLPEQLRLDLLAALERNIEQQAEAQAPVQLPIGLKELAPEQVTVDDGGADHAGV